MDGRFDNPWACRCRDHNDSDPETRPILENRLDGGADVLAQTIFDQIVARLIGQ